MNCLPASCITIDVNMMSGGAVDDEREREILAEALMPDVPTEVGAEMLKDDSVPSEESVVVNEGEENNSRKKKKKRFKAREHVPRAPKEESHWHRRCLQPDRRVVIEEAEGNPNAPKAHRKLERDFHVTFRVCWSLFRTLCQLMIIRGFHDPMSLSSKFFDVVATWFSSWNWTSSSPSTSS